MKSNGISRLLTLDSWFRCYGKAKYGEAYVAQGRAEYEQAYRNRTSHNLRRKTKALGDKVLPPTDVAAPEAPA